MRFLSPTAWRWLLPILAAIGLGVGTRLRAQDTAIVYVATRTLPRGTTLSARDFAPARHGTRRPATVALRPEPGWITRRVIRAGEVLATPAVTPPPTVAAGAAVSYIIWRGRIELALAGVAMTSGARGDTILVRLDTHRRVTGVVAGPTRVIAPATDSLPQPRS